MVSSLDPVSGKVIDVALELGVFQALEGEPRSAEALAELLGLSLRGLKPVLYLLSSLGLLSESAAGFVASQGAAQYLQHEWPQARQQLFPAPDWDGLAQVVREGRCLGEAIEGEGDAGNFFSDVVPLLFELHLPMAKYLGQQLDPGSGPILDLGAGSAVWSLGMLLHHPELRCVAVDRARVLDQVTGPTLQRHHLAERYELRPGSYYEVPLEAGGYSLIYLGHLLHSDGLDLSRQLLLRCRQALQPGGRVVVAEMVGSEPRSLDYESNLFDLNMLMFTEHGLVFTARELEELGLEAGYTLEGWVKGPGQYPVLVLRGP